jgi:hypothetical protein
LIWRRASESETIAAAKVAIAEAHTPAASQSLTGSSIWGHKGHTSLPRHPAYVHPQGSYENPTLI